MFKRLALFALLAAAPAHAETLSAEIGRTGLTATEARLSALPSPSDDETLALGAVQFLRAIEGSFQTRWTYGMTDRSGMLPLLRLPLDDNPAPTAFDSKVIAQIFTEAEAGLAAAITTFAKLPDTSPAAVDLALADLWFDVNQNTTREQGEGLEDIIGSFTTGLPEAGAAQPTLPSIRFDIADAAWASAYAHLLSGVANAVLAYDPSEPIARILEARLKLAEFGPPPPSFLTGQSQIPDEIDMIAMILAALDQQPDTARAAAAHQHFLAMIEDNRRFWRLVDLETDNTREWLPNPRQTAALGLPLPPETGATWLAVLTEAEAALKGEKLIPYWRAGDKGGVNLQQVFLDPRPVDVAGWIQGWAATPYMQAGPLMTTTAWDQFAGMMTGDAMLFALWLN